MHNSKSSFKILLPLDLWREFKLVELTEIMRQRGDTNFIETLNKICIKNSDEKVDTALQSSFTDKQDRPQQNFKLHIYAENEPVNEHKKAVLD